MGPIDKRQYWTIEEYKEFEKVFIAFAEMILFAMAQYPATTKDIIIRNFIARSLKMLQGVFQLWDIEDYPDCWILFRCMLDRLFLLNDLSVSEEFQVFDDWSFMHKYKKRHEIRSDSEFNGRLCLELLKDTPEQKIRIKKLDRTKPEWKRPRAEDVAKRMGLKPLYDYGYDISSTLVHPMADDGQRDFEHLINLGNQSDFPDEIAILNNTCLIAHGILHEGMKECSLSWRVFVTDVLKEFLLFIETGSKDYKTSFVRISEVGPEIISMLCVESNDVKNS